MTSRGQAHHVICVTGAVPEGLKKFVDDIQGAFQEPSVGEVCLRLLRVSAGFVGAKVKKGLLSCVMAVVNTVTDLLEGCELDTLVVQLLRSVIEGIVSSGEEFVTDMDSLIREFTAVFEDPFHAPGRFLSFVVSILKPEALLPALGSMLEVAFLDAEGMVESFTAEAVEALNDLISAVKTGTVQTLQQTSEIKELISSLMHVADTAVMDSAAASQRLLVLVRVTLKIEDSGGL